MASQANHTSLSLQSTTGLLKRMVPSMSFQHHKGSMGRIAILGGSSDYTGAPYYAGHAALKFGGDLAFIFCSMQAAIPIKSYSPELMVMPYYDEIMLDTVHLEEIAQYVDISSRRVEDILARVHVIVIGCGMGRQNRFMDMFEAIIAKANARNIPIVIDADGLHFAAQRLSLIQGRENIFITPNKIEFSRLVTSAVCELSLSIQSVEEKGTGSTLDHQKLIEMLMDLQSNEDVRQLRGLAKYLRGVTVLKKGVQDMICAGGEDVYVLEGQAGSPRRCGGQGDILAGCLGIAVHWTTMMTAEGHEDEEQRSPSHSVCATSSQSVQGSWGQGQGQGRLSKQVLAAALSSFTVRQAGAMAFQEHGRSMTSPDVLNHIGRGLEELIK